MKPFRLGREVNGEYVDILEIQEETLEKAVEEYWFLLALSKS